jgi:hypothetical protein
LEDELKLFALVILLSILLIGCVHVPKSTVQCGDIKLSFPKDMEMHNVKWDTDGSKTTVTIESMKSANNPLVIDSTAAGQVALIGAYEKLFESGVQAGAKLMSPVP